MGSIVKVFTDVIGSVGSAIVGSTFGAADNAANSAIDYEYWYKQRAQEQRFQKEMVDYQNEQSKMMTAWNNEQNKQLYSYYDENYLSPEAVMNRYQKAGINPNLVAGQVSGNGSAALSNVASSASGGSGVSGFSGNGVNGITAAYQMQQIKAMKIQNKERELEYMTKMFNIMVPEYEETFDKDGNSKQRKLSRDERVMKGFELLNAHMYQFRGLDFQLKVAQVAGQISGYSSDVVLNQLKEKGGKKLLDSEVYPLFVNTINAMSEGLLTGEKRNLVKEQIKDLKAKNDFGIAQINQFIDDLDIDNGIKSYLKMGLGLIFKALD